MLPLIIAYRGRKAIIPNKKSVIDCTLSSATANWMPVERIRSKTGMEQWFLLWKLYPDHCIEI